MLQLIVVLIIIILTGAVIYILKYKGKEKPRVGIKRDNKSDYLKDYINLKLYWTSILFIVFGSSILLAMLIITYLFSSF